MIYQYAVPQTIYLPAPVVYVPPPPPPPAVVYAYPPGYGTRVVYRRGYPAY